MASKPLSQLACLFSDWAFDVSAFMVLIGETEELRYRLAGRTLSECLVATPAAGIQSYLRPYSLLLDHSTLSYFSPVGCKSAPLRNMRLDDAIRQWGALEDGQFSVYRVMPSSAPSSSAAWWSMRLWVAFTWTCFAALIVAYATLPCVTWIGLTSCVVFTGWSVILRLVEHIMVRPSTAAVKSVSNPDAFDGIYFLGRNNSALVIEGSRADVKRWTAAGLVYGKENDNSNNISNTYLQGLTRFGTLLALATVFVTVPNGSTVDQLIFVIFNIFGQANVLMGRWLSARRCLGTGVFVKEETASRSVTTRTEVYGYLLRQFRHLRNDEGWVDKAGLLPKTDVWDEWKVRVVEEVNVNPKVLYNRILRERRGSVSKMETDMD